MGQALNAEIGELPVNILDRGSDGSDTEPAGQSEAASPIAIDCSDHDVDVETVEENGSLLGSDDDKGPMRRADSKATPAANQREAGTVDSGSQPTVEGDATPTTTDLNRDSEVSDSRLLATILNDLKGIAAPKCGLTLSFEPSSSSNNRKQHFRDQCEVSQAHSNQDNWLAETRHPSYDLPEERQSNDSREQNQGFDLPTFHTSIPTLPSLERLKECRVREEGKDLPPLLKQASPVRSYNRNTPPPLKHKDAVSPHLLSPIDLHSPHASVDVDQVAVNSRVELNSNSTSSPIDSHLGAELPKDGQAIPPISTLKRHFTSTSALRGEPAFARHISAVDMHPSCHLAPIDSHSTAPSQVGAFSIHTMSRKPPTGSFSGSENRSPSDDCLPHQDFNSFHSSKLHSGLDGTKEIFSDPRSSPIDLHPVNSLSPIDFHSANTDWSKDKSVHTDSTSRDCRNKTLSPNSCRGAPIDLHLSSSVSAEGTPAGTDIFSGANCNNTSPTGFVPFIDSGTQSPSSPIDSSRKREKLSERLSSSRVRSVPKTAASVRSLPTDVHPRSLKFTTDLQSSNAASEGLTESKASSLVIHQEGLPHGHLPPIDLHCTSPAPPANKPSFVSIMTDRHSNHTALSSPTFQTSHGKPQSKNPVESHSKCLPPGDSVHNRFDSNSDSEFPIDNCSKRHLPSDSQCESQPPVDSHSKKSRRHFQPRAANHVASSPQSAENQWNSSIDTHSESQSPIDKRSASSIWNKHTHSAT